jgi:hypothetical protein
VLAAPLSHLLTKTQPEGMETLPALPVAGVCMLVPPSRFHSAIALESSQYGSATLGLFQPTPSDVKERRRKMRAEGTVSVHLLHRVVPARPDSRRITRAQQGPANQWREGGASRPWLIRTHAPDQIPPTGFKST